MKNHFALVLCATMAAGLGPASAADLPRKGPTATPIAITDWTGFYLGGALGFRAADVDAGVTSVVTGGVDIFAPTCAGIGGCAGQELDSVGVKGGLYAGFNWQFAPRWVVGVEADWMWADHQALQRGMTFPTTLGDPFLGMTGNAADSFSASAEWDASLRARLGFLLTPSVMVFATGGASWISLETMSTCNTAGVSCGPPALLAPAAASNSDTVLGWTVGGGIEAMLSPNWLLRGEYRYADYGTNSYSITRTSAVAGVSFTSNYDVQLRTHSAMLGLAYKFGGGVSPLSARAEAFAAPAPAVANWSGLYVGAAAGLRAADADANTTSALLAGGDVFTPACVVNGCLGQPFDSSGFKAGVYGGYNWHLAPALVVGLEADWMWADHDATFNGALSPTSGAPFFAGVTAQAGDSFSVRTKWDASLRARIGTLITPSILVFATGGASWASLETTSACSAPPAGSCGGLLEPPLVSTSDTRLGWTIGAGVEAMLAGNWLIRAEYRYADYGSQSYTLARMFGGIPISVPLVATYDLELRTHTALFGIAYKFDWGAPAVARN